MRHAILTTTLLFALSLSAEARAQLADTTVDTDWYGWQTLLSDGLSIGTMVLGGVSESPELALLGAASFIVTPPIIHMAHRNWLGAGISLTLRAGGTALLIAGLAIALSNLDFGGDEESGASDDDDSDGGAAALSLIGLFTLIAAPFVDVALAKEKRPERPAQAWSVQPWLSPQARGGGITFAARL